MIDKTPTNKQAINQHCHAVRNESSQILAWIPEAIYTNNEKMQQLREALIEWDTLVVPEER
jgi:hypothetical protein